MQLKKAVSAQSQRHGARKATQHRLLHQLPLSPGTATGRQKRELAMMIWFEIMRRPSGNPWPGPCQIVKSSYVAVVQNAGRISLPWSGFPMFPPLRGPSGNKPCLQPLTVMLPQPPKSLCSYDSACMDHAIKHELLSERACT